MTQLKVFLPTLTRYALLILATKLTAGGWLPSNLANQLTTDPAVVELVSGLVLGGATVAWFMVSKAKKAIALFDDEIEDFFGPF